MAADGRAQCEPIPEMEETLVSSTGVHGGLRDGVELQATQVVVLQDNTVQKDPRALQSGDTSVCRCCNAAYARDGSLIRSEKGLLFREGTISSSVEQQLSVASDKHTAASRTAHELVNSLQRGVGKSWHVWRVSKDWLFGHVSKVIQLVLLFSTWFSVAMRPHVVKFVAMGSLCVGRTQPRPANRASCGHEIEQVSKAQLHPCLSPGTVDYRSVRIVTGGQHARRAQHLKHNT